MVGRGPREFIGAILRIHCRLARSLLGGLECVLTHGHRMADLIALGNTFYVMALPCLAYVYWREQVDEQDRLSMQMVQSGRLEIAGQLGSGVAHDFNNHLQAILGHAQPTAKTNQNPETESQRFELISESVEKASNLIHQLLALNADNEGYRIEVLDLNELLRTLSPLLESQLKPTQKIDLQLDGKNTTVVANRAMMEQSIINLINNARDALHDEGKITIKSVFQPQPESRQSRSYGVQLSITDNGSGMDAETLNQIYEPFFTTKGVGKGTGLGLSSVYNYMRRIGGQIRVDSQPGSGTTVKLNFPEPNLPAFTENEPSTFLSTNTPEASMQSQETASDDSPQTVVRQAFILLAEGSAAIRNTAAAQLRSAGHSVTAVSNGEAATQCLRSSAGNRFDLLLLDVSLPLLAGYEVFDTAIDLYPGIPVVFLSEPGQHTSSQLTEHAHLIKPFHREQLLSTIRGTLEKPTA